ncbi:uncharacterized protein LOC130912013 isoform X4 [Corythoichthys intestinalis]|uniref:uncharacterized protein LOC130912013 isoform X4 n=1 Tax=Corythoichthys intestinalis TaxID=161448 RepID=UPI0025A640B4|nr:uncharacterized protein LOC130912013 isoform X4 [Corythoichthys intestinalis]
MRKITHRGSETEEMSEKAQATWLSDNSPSDLSGQSIVPVPVCSKHFGSDVTLEHLHPEKHNQTHIKQEEDKMTYIKEEEQDHQFAMFPLTVIVKDEEDDGPSQERRTAKTSSHNLFQDMTSKDIIDDLHREMHDPPHV